MVMTIDTVARIGARKAAVLIVALGGDLAAPLLRNLRDDQVEAITREIVTMNEVSDREKFDVLEGCHEVMRKRGIITPNGTNIARDLLSHALGTQKANELLTRVTTGREEAFAFVRHADLAQIVDYFEAEHPQTIALALSHMPPELAAQVLGSLSAETQSDVAVRIARIGRTDPDIVREVEAAMRRKLAHYSNEGFQSVGGLDYLVTLLGTCDSRTERAILEAIEQSDPDLAKELRDRMFTFQDLAALDDRSIQRLLREVESRDLALALRGAPEEVRLRVMRNLSSRAAHSLAEDIERFGPIRLRLVEEAQQKIVDIARHLQESEEIVVPRGRQDVFV